MNPIIIKGRIRQCMEEHGDNQADLARKLGISRSSITKWFKDPDNGLHTGNVMAIADLYGVNVGWLLGVEGEPKDPESPEHVSKRAKINDRLRNCSMEDLDKISAMIDLMLNK